MITVQNIKKYRILKEEIATNFQERIKDDKYKKILDRGKVLTDNHKGLFIYNGDEEIGYFIIDKYKNEDDAAIAYLRLYNPIPIEDKKDIIKAMLVLAQSHNFTKLFFRAQEDDELLKRSLLDLGFILHGEFITTIEGNGFSHYKVYTRAVHAVNSIDDNFEEDGTMELTI